jgi:DNA-binding NarL/FixJ family response regulator
MLLILEDDETTARTLVRLVGDAWTCRVMASSSEAHQAAMGHDTDWSGFVVDLALPEGPRAGFDVLRELRTRWRHVPAMVVTGAPLERLLVTEAASMGARYVRKPADGDALASFLETVRDHRERRARRVPAAVAFAARRLGLTSREEELLAWVAAGKSRDAFFGQAGVSHENVRVDVDAILVKAHAESLSDLGIDLLREV